MKRRNFLKTSSVTSACAFAGTMMGGEAIGHVKTESYSVKITVLKTEHNKEWSKQLRGHEGKKCDLFSEGQEFDISSPWEPPAGFCPWAWGDIRTFIHKVNDGGMENFVTCCTDGFRPVFFKIERVLKED